MEGVNNRQVLAEALSSRLAQSSRRLLFTLDVSINDAISTLEFYEGQEPYEAARNFLVEHGLKDSEDFENFHSAIVNGIREKLSALTAEQEQDPLENKLSIPVTIGEEVFTVYFDKGTTVNDVSSAFCTQKLDTVRAAMNEDVSLEVCTKVLQNSILESMRKGE
ncbi:unnamed protein product [Symbiodinium sp. KB8]|nr:unnamed protein product [Symbiodinium sp. KB8]